MDFMQAISTLCQEDHHLGLQFASADLAGALDVIYQRVAVEFVPVEPGWFRATLLAALAGDPDAGKKKAPSSFHSTGRNSAQRRLNHSKPR